MRRIATAAFLKLGNDDVDAFLKLGNDGAL